MDIVGQVQYIVQKARWDDMLAFLLIKCSAVSVMFRHIYTFSN